MNTQSEWAKDFFVGDEERIRTFSRLIGDWNPIHHSTAMAKAVGLKGIIAPGVMVIGFISATIAHERPGAMVRSLQVKFREPLYAGSQVTVFCKISRMVKIFEEVSVEVKSGSKSCAEGSCLLVLP